MLTWVGKIKASNHEPLKTYINGSEIASFIALTDDTKASQLKKHLHATFTPNGVLNYETHVDDTVTELLSHLHGLSSASPTAKTTDLADWMSWFAFDTITRIGLSENQGFMRKQMDVDGVGASAAKRFAHWNFYWTIPWLEALIYKNAYTRNKKTPPRAGLFALAVRVVEQRIQQQRQTEKTSLQDEEKQQQQQQQQQTKDLLSLYMDAAIQSPNLYTKQTIIAMTITTIQAGAETTAYTTSILLYLLLTHPQVLTTLRKELSTLQSSPTRCILPMSALRKLPYLDACIKESMRLKPAVNIVTERVTTHYIPDLGGVAIPAGTIVAVNNAGIYSDCEIWGEDVGVFRPERWIGEDVGEESKIVMQKAFLGFSKGARMCLGINVAGMEIRKVVAGLVMEFDVSFFLSFFFLFFFFPPRLASFQFAAAAPPLPSSCFLFISLHPSLDIVLFLAVYRSLHRYARCGIIIIIMPTLLTLIMIV
jgi:cytochrome P450